MKSTFPSLALLLCLLFDFFLTVSAGGLDDARKSFKEAGLVSYSTNDSCCQAVSYKGAVCAIVHKPGVYKLGKHRVEANEPDMLVLR